MGKEIERIYDRDHFEIRKGEYKMKNEEWYLKRLEEERMDGFKTGVLFTIMAIGIGFLAWFVVFAPMGWWL